MNDRQILVLLALLSAILFVYRKQWENAFTRFVFATAYFLVVTNIVNDAGESMFLIRWSLLLLLSVEILYGVVTTLRKKRKP